MLLRLPPMLMLWWCSFLIDDSLAHIGEECKMGFCMNALFIKIRNTYCDSNNLCQCEDGYINVALHKCAQIQNVGGLCDHDLQCKTMDEFAHCDKSHFKSTCECRKGYQYDEYRKKCFLVVKKPKSTPIFPLTAVLLIALIALFCGCGILCHNLRRSPEFVLNPDQRRVVLEQRSRLRAQGGGTSGGGRNNSTNRTNSMRAATSDNVSNSSKFDDEVLYDEPPPNYEEAIKEYPTQVVVDSQAKRSHQASTTIIATTTTTLKSQ